MKIFLILFLSLNATSAQIDSVFKGILKIENEFLEGISIKNLNTKNAVLSGYKGVFAISASAKDTLLFTGLNIISKKVIVFSRNLKTVENVVKLQYKENNIALILVINSSTWAKILGIAPKDEHHYTKEERAVKAAVENELTIRPLYVGGSLDPLINMISGRTKKLKTDLAIANKVNLQDKITVILSKENITKLHLIPAEFVDGFLFYLVENNDLNLLMNEKNFNVALLKIGELAIEYKKINKIVPLENEKQTDEIISK